MGLETYEWVWRARRLQGSCVASRPSRAAYRRFGLRIKREIKETVLQSTNKLVYRILLFRFVYGMGYSKQTELAIRLVKLNVETKEVVTWEESGGFTSEPVFVKAPDGKTEDDGIVLSCVINVIDQTTSLLVLDAKEFKELGRAVVQGITPATFHGMFQ